MYWKIISRIFGHLTQMKAKKLTKIIWWAKMFEKKRKVARDRNQPTKIIYSWKQKDWHLNTYKLMVLIWIDWSIYIGLMGTRNTTDCRKKIEWNGILQYVSRIYFFCSKIFEQFLIWNFSLFPGTVNKYIYLCYNCSWKETSIYRHIEHWDSCNDLLIRLKI